MRWIAASISCRVRWRGGVAWRLEVSPYLTLTREFSILSTTKVKFLEKTKALFFNFLLALWYMIW